MQVACGACKVYGGEGGRLPTICVAFVSAILADIGEDLPLRDGCILPNILFLNLISGDFCSFLSDKICIFAHKIVEQCHF